MTTEALVDVLAHQTTIAEAINHRVELIATPLALRHHRVIEIIAVEAEMTTDVRLRLVVVAETLLIDMMAEDEAGHVLLRMAAT